MINENASRIAARYFCEANPRYAGGGLDGKMEIGTSPGENKKPDVRGIEDIGSACGIYLSGAME